MSWYNPLTWGSKSTTLTLDQAISRLELVRNTASGVRVTPETAMKAPTVFAIVNTLSRSVASLPVYILKDESVPGKRKQTRQPQHPVAKLLRKPNKIQTPYDYWSLVMTRLVLYGEFFARKLQSANGRIVQLVPIAPTDVEIEQTIGGQLQFRIQLPNGESETATQSQMHWITKLSLDGLRGITPVTTCKESIALEIAAEEFGATVFGSGAVPNLLIKHPSHFKDQEAADRFKESWNSAYRKKRGTAVLEDGMSIEAVQMNNEESQFLETRKLQRSVIAGAFGVPPHMIGDLERATFSNIEQMSLDFVINTLTPYLDCIEHAISRDLLSEQDRQSKIFARFDTTEMLRGDMKSRADAMKILREWGVITANEWRAFESLDAREDEGGDDFLTPLNFGSSDDDDDEDEQGEAQLQVVRRLR
jgi:HK97 family phage portal protein